MPLEIERRFLVRGGQGVWSTDSVRIVQGYIPLPEGWNQRVRIIGDAAELTEKRLVAPGVREEFTRPIAVLDALDLLFSHCAGRIVEKVRHLVPAGGRTWEVDVFLGANRGLVIAEVELDHAHEDIDLPPWIGREVTSDPRYGNSSLARAPFSTWVSAAAACPKPKWTRTDPSPRRLRPPRQDVTDAAAPWLGAPSCSSGVRLTPVSPC